MRFCRISAVIFAISFAIESYGAVNVTASRDYVDQRILQLSKDVNNSISNLSSSVSAKRGLEDYGVRGSPSESGHFFTMTVDGGTTHVLDQYSESQSGVKTWTGASGVVRLVGGSFEVSVSDWNEDHSFELEVDYTATVMRSYSTGMCVLTGYVDRLAIASETESMVAITHAELLAMRDAEQLKPGRQYRIIDYVATSNGDMNSRSAGHPFDIVVTADDERTLNEHARAVLHDGELPDDIVDGTTRRRYFADCNLAAWDVWYCIDNDTKHFEWADATNGKGVIFRLVDEFKNDAPYDFKGIQFRRWAVTNIISELGVKYYFVKSKNSGLYYATSSSDRTYNGITLEVDSSDSVWYYTFGGAVDLSCAGYTKDVFANKIERWDWNGNRYALNNIVFLGLRCNNNTFGSSCRINTFGPECYNNTFGNDSSYNVFGKYCRYNTFGTDCYNNVLGEACYNNTFGTDCKYNSLDGYSVSNKFGFDCSYNLLGNCENNIFGNYCHNNTFGNSCYRNTFGSYCENNTFGSYCQNNTFGSSCQNNTFGMMCKNNTFGMECENNTFSQYCNYNTFGSHCQNNKFASTCTSNTFGTECGRNTFGSSCYRNTFGSHCTDNKFNFSCSYNTFGHYCINHTFGNQCSVNTFDSYCHNNTFGTFCVDNTFGLYCSYNKFGTESSVKSYCRFIRVGSGNSYLYINPTGTTSSSQFYQNVEIKEGVNNTTTYKTINDPNVGQTFHTTYKPADSQEISL